MIRSATADDAAALQELYTYLQPDDPVAEPTAFHAVLQEIEKNDAFDVLIYEIEGSAVSSCYVNIVPNLTRGLRPYAVVENVVTHPGYRKRGYATALLQEAMDRAEERGCYKVMLMTGSKRESTLRFYEKAGLQPGVKTAFATRIP